MFGVIIYLYYFVFQDRGFKVRGVGHAGLLSFLGELLQYGSLSPVPKISDFGRID